jgi:hypothetical protein
VFLQVEFGQLGRLEMLKGMLTTHADTLLSILCLLAAVVVGKLSAAAVALAEF